jgi:hypothetical protein
LNDPAGRVAKVIVRHAVTEIVAAWSDASRDPEQAIESVLSCFCHPALLNQTWQLHRDMFAVVKDWVDNLPPQTKPRILQGLTSEGVRRGENHDNEVSAKVNQKSVALGGASAFVLGGASYSPVGSRNIVESPQTRGAIQVGPSSQFRDGALDSPPATLSPLWPYNLDYNQPKEDSYQIALSQSQTWNEYLAPSNSDTRQLRPGQLGGAGSSGPLGGGSRFDRGANSLDSYSGTNQYPRQDYDYGNQSPSGRSRYGSGYATGGVQSPSVTQRDVST